MMDFFEALKKRAWAKFAIDLDDAKLSEPREVLHPIDATIEALKEMKVEGPIEAIDDTRAFERYLYKSDNPFLFVWNGPALGDGEEVVVMVFKCEKKD